MIKMRTIIRSFSRKCKNVFQAITEKEEIAKTILMLESVKKNNNHTDLLVKSSQIL